MMVDLLDKHKGILERVQRMTAMGINGLGVTNDKMISPTRAMVGNREIITGGHEQLHGHHF